MRCRGIVILKYMTLLPKLWQFAQKKKDKFGNVARDGITTNSRSYGD